MSYYHNFFMLVQQFVGYLLFRCRMAGEIRSNSCLASFIAKVFARATRAFCSAVPWDLGRQISAKISLGPRHDFRKLFALKMEFALKAAESIPRSGYVHRQHRMGDKRNDLGDIMGFSWKWGSHFLIKIYSQMQVQTKTFVTYYFRLKINSTTD